jgi:hypothetical protein
MLNTVPVPVSVPVGASLIGGSPEEVFQQAVVSVEPSHHVAQGDLDWWLGLQERLEIRADMRQAGLL